MLVPVLSVVWPQQQALYYFLYFDSKIPARNKFLQEKQLTDSRKIINCLTC